MLCHTCTSILRGQAWGERMEDDKATRFPHHRTIVALKAAAEEQRCYYCRPLWCKLSPEFQQAIESRCRCTEDSGEYLQWASVTELSIYPRVLEGQQIWECYIHFDYHLQWALYPLHHVRDEPFPSVCFRLQPTKGTFHTGCTRLQVRTIH